jgi:hypothetical protein
MNPLDALIRVLQLDRTQILASATQDAKLPQVQIGQKVAAKVEAQLPNGNFKVRIENQPLQMNLPAGTKAGDTLDLVLLTREPRLTFKLDQTQNLPQSELSQTGRLISQLLPDPSKQTAPMAGAKPVLPSPPQESGQLAQALQNTLSKSGLFYESHQAQWVMGQRPLEQLLQEPQNVQTAQPAPAEIKLQGQLTQQSAAHMAKGSADVSELKIKDSVLPVVKQQIQTLESQEFSWNGQIWPGQNMEWQIREEEDQHRGGSSEETAQRAWYSRLRLALPNLGQIDANLRLSGSGVQISFQVAKPQTQNSLKMQMNRLQDSLQANGVNLLSSTVQHG